MNGYCIEIYVAPGGEITVSREEKTEPPETMGQPAASMDEALEMARTLAEGPAGEPGEMGAEESPEDQAMKGYTRTSRGVPMRDVFGA